MNVHRFDDSERDSARRWIAAALEEDHVDEDHTSRLAVPAHARGRFEVRNRRPGALAGIEAIGLTFERLGAEVEIETLVTDGTRVDGPGVLARIEGPRRAVLGAERTFLNLLGLLSGTATLTRAYVDAAGPRCRVLDTRKTIPGYRRLQKYAVRCGGGVNHRMHLGDGILLKDNHRHGALALTDLLERARAELPGVPRVVEVDDFDQLDEALALPVHRILLDNFDPDRVREAVRRRDARAPGVELEVSGGVDLSTVGPLARAGADCVSVGALTHSAPVWDVGLDEVVRR